MQIETSDQKSSFGEVLFLMKHLEGTNLRDVVCFQGTGTVSIETLTSAARL